MRDRLIELLKMVEYQYTEIHSIMTQNVADFLLQKGVIVPSCKVGDKVYVGNLHTKISEIIIETDITFMCYFDCDWVIENVGCGDCPFADWYTTYEGDIDCQAMGCFSFTEKDIGKTVFLTKEEAEKALSKLQASYEQVKGGAE